MEERISLNCSASKTLKKRKEKLKSVIFVINLTKLNRYIRNSNVILKLNWYLQND